jgi:hypothetical protein
VSPPHVPFASGLLNQPAADVASLVWGAPIAHRGGAPNSGANVWVTVAAPLLSPCRELNAFRVSWWHRVRGYRALLEGAEGFSDLDHRGSHARFVEGALDAKVASVCYTRETLTAQLPVAAIRSEFLDALQRGPVVLLFPTGSGKSTEVPGPHETAPRQSRASPRAGAAGCTRARGGAGWRERHVVCGGIHQLGILVVDAAALRHGQRVWFGALGRVMREPKVVRKFERLRRGVWTDVDVGREQFARTIDEVVHEAPLRCRAKVELFGARGLLQNAHHPALGIDNRVVGRYALQTADEGNRRGAAPKQVGDDAQNDQINDLGAGLRAESLAPSCARRARPSRSAATSRRMASENSSWDTRGVRMVARMARRPELRNWSSLGRVSLVALLTLACSDKEAATNTDGTDAGNPSPSETDDGETNSNSTDEDGSDPENTEPGKPTDSGSGTDVSDESETGNSGTDDSNTDNSSTDPDGPGTSDGSDDSGSDDSDSDDSGSDEGDTSDASDGNDDGGTSDDGTDGSADDPGTVDDGGDTGNGGPDGSGSTGPGRNLPTQPGPESASGVEVTENAIEVDSKDQLRWFFVVENNSDVPACGGEGPARLYGANNELLAEGSEDTFYPESGIPAFFVATYGTLFRDPGAGLRNCVPPGGHGIGVGDFLTPSGKLTDEQRDELLSQGTRIEFDLGLVTDGSDLEPADDLFEIGDQELTDTPEGKVASATMTGNSAVIGLQFYVALFDGDTPIDFVNKAGGEIMAGGTKEIVMPAGSPDATRFELFVSGSEPRQ